VRGDAEHIRDILQRKAFHFRNSRVDRAHGDRLVFHVLRQHRRLAAAAGAVGGVPRGAHIRYLLLRRVDHVHFQIAGRHTRTVVHS
jgi:hypothetical protein